MTPVTRYAAGVVHFAADPGLEDCLASLFAQQHPPECVFVVDHDGNLEAPSALRERFPALEWIGTPNTGYAAGANRILTECERHCPQAEFALVLNSDVTLEPDFSAALLAEVTQRPEVALASGKLLRPGGETIDSAGIQIGRTRRFRDRGSEELDVGQYESVEEVFAVSGAAVLVRRSLLGWLEVEGEIFDEDFFVYHEDTDLAWRARSMGFSTLYVPRARATHARGWRRRDRSRIAPIIRRHSFKNRYLEMLKNEQPLAFLRDLPFILTMEAARLGFALVADRAVLVGYLDAARHARRAWHKRRIIRGTAKRSLALRPRDGPAARNRVP